MFITMDMINPISLL